MAVTPSSVQVYPPQSRAIGWSVNSVRERRAAWILARLAFCFWEVW